jgi:hypothetical protein
MDNRQEKKSRVEREKERVFLSQSLFKHTFSSLDLAFLFFCYLIAFKTADRNLKIEKKER